jgi:hypothetical protein
VLQGVQVQPSGQLSDDRPDGASAVFDQHPRADLQRPVGQPAQVRGQLGDHARRLLGVSQHLAAPGVDLVAQEHGDRLPGDGAQHRTVGSVDAGDGGAPA